MRRHLYVRVYLTILLVMLASLSLAGVAAWLLDLTDPVQDHFHTLAEVMVEDLPAQAEARDALLDHRAERLGLRVALLDSGGAVLFDRGVELSHPLRTDRDDHRVHLGGGPMGWAFHLEDGRWLVVAPGHSPHRHLPSHGLMLLLVALIIGVGAWPVARGVTWRLVELREGVDSLGAGELSRRVEVRGRDEVAALASSFNRAADRIEALVTSQRRMVASASHELRSPLARLRMSAELLAEADTEAEREHHLAAAVRDIEELDQLVGDLLLSGRLELMERPEEPVDLLALAAEEASRAEAEVEGEPVEVRGDERLLRQAVRNLLDNARKHGAEPITVRVARTGEGVELSVSDSGEGVPESERERIFEPFYRPDGHAEGRDGGVGLGLSLVERIARLHGGAVRCEGARFVIELPRRAPSPRAGAPLSA